MMLKNENSHNLKNDVLKNVLGNIDPNVSINVFGGKYGRPLTETVWNRDGRHETVNYPRISVRGLGIADVIVTWNTAEPWNSDSLESMKKVAISWMVENGFRIEKMQTIAGTQINGVHTNSEIALNAQKAAQADEDKNAVRGYVRYGKPPVGGRSYNYRDNFYENGVSAYNALFYADGSYRIIRDNAVQDFGCISYDAQRPAYRIWGKCLGTGSDGEPVLKVTKYTKLGAE